MRSANAALPHTRHAANYVAERNNSSPKKNAETGANGGVQTKNVSIVKKRCEGF